MTSALDHALTIKGFLLARDAPQGILSGIDIIIHVLSGSLAETRQRQGIESAVVADIPKPHVGIHPDWTPDPLPEPPPPAAEKKARKPWSPEARQRASERMAARIASGAFKPHKHGQKPAAVPRERDLGEA